MIVPFKLPADVADASFEKILTQMLEGVSDKYDKVEGGFVHDMIAPAALEAAELIQFWLALALKTNFHMYAEGIWLDRHAADCGLTRREATPSYGTLDIVTCAPVTFPEGFVFSVPSENGTPALDFETTEDVTIDGAGSCRVRAVEAGLSGNVAAQAISIMKNPLKDVLSITNPAPFTGGTQAESDSSLRRRIDDFYAGRSSSFVGNCADYRRWSLQVAGIGYVHVVPTFKGENSVKILLADSNGVPATTELCAAVEEYIFGKSHDDLKRLAPVGVTAWEVVPFVLKEINLSFEATLSLEASLVEENIRSDLLEFIQTLADDELNYGVLKYNDVAAVLSKVTGLEDFRNLLLNGEVANIHFGAEQLPVIAAVVF